MSRVQAEGFAIVARRHRIEYRQPAVLDDELELTTWISDVKRATAIRHYTVTRVSDGALLARARTLWVWVDAKTGRPIRIPDGFLADFAPNIADEQAGVIS
jgi:acyl-CoA thioester hydrolase